MILDNTGLSVHIHQSTKKGEGWIADYTKKLAELQLEINMTEGFAKARISFQSDLGDLNDWYEYGLGRVLKVYDSSGELAWRGFANIVTISVGSKQETRGPLLDTANRCLAIYTPIDETNSNVAGSQTITTLVEDGDSILQYGAIEKQISVGTCYPDTAEKTRDLYLAENSWPKTSGPLELGDSGANPLIEVEFTGDIAWLETYYYYNMDTGGITVYDKLIDILGTDPNGFISSKYGLIKDHVLYVPAGEDYQLARSSINKILAIGNDTDDTRRVFGIFTDDLRISYYPVPIGTQYNLSLSDPTQAVYTSGGQLVLPWRVLPGRWIETTDFLAGRTPTQNSRRDPRIKLIESVTYTAPWTVELVGAESNTVKALIAKISYTGGAI